jgi:TolB-like protein
MPMVQSSGRPRKEYLAEGVFDGFLSRSRIKKEIRVVNFVIDVNVKEN